jgi:hypothetical protein
MVTMPRGGFLDRMCEIARRGVEPRTEGEVDYEEGAEKSETKK